MTTRSGRQYIPPSTTVISITLANLVTTTTPPKWSHKHIFDTFDLANTHGGIHDLPRKITLGYLHFQERGDHMVTCI